MRMIFILGLMVSGICLQAKKIDGFEFPDKLKQEGSELVLNGCGTRKKMFVKIYCAGLYLLKKESNGAIVTDADKAMAVKMRFIYSHVSKEKIASVWNDCFYNVTNGKTDPIKKEIKEFLSYFGKEDVKGGDVFDLVYIPSKGVRVYKKDKLVGTVKGLPFKKALFSVWFGDKPIQNDLKENMLGK